MVMVPLLSLTLVSWRFIGQDKQKMKLLVQIVFGIALLFLGAQSAYGAEIVFSPENEIVARGQEFVVPVELDTKGESLNAISGQVLFSSEFLTVQELRDGNSSINFWVERPRVTHAGVITFSGITPRGFARDRELLFSIVFRAEKEGETSLSLAHVTVLKNDGQGTPAGVTVLPTSLSITRAGASPGTTIPPIHDSELPEDFLPTIVRDPHLFNNEYGVVFATQDKLSGIDHYELREGRWGAFKRVSSPYHLQRQALDVKIFIKAIDKSGNERVVTVTPDTYRRWSYGLYIIVFVILVGIVGLIFKNIWRRHYF